MYRTALRNVLAHKGRLLMTMLAVLLGTASVAGTLVFSDSVGQSLKDSISTSFTGISVQVADKSTGGDGGPKEQVAGGVPLTDATLKAVRAVPDVQSARGTVSGFAGISDAHGNLIGSRGDTFGGNWAPGSDGKDQRYPMAQGTGPTGPTDVAIDQKTASSHGFKVGDSVRVAVTGPVLQATVTGIFTTDDPQVKSGGTLVLFDTATAQRFYLKPGQFSDISAQAKPGVSDDQLATEIEGVLPKAGNLKVKTIADLRSDQTSMIASATVGLKIVLLAFAGISLFVGIFLISNTFSMLIAQRTRELALLRAVGASRRQVKRSVLLEALLIGGIASVVGLLVGIGIGLLMQSVVGSSDPAATGDVVISPTSVLATLATGIVVTAVSAMLPARRASRIAPVAAMSANETPATQKSLIVRNSIGVVLTAIGLLAVVFGATRNGGNFKIVGLGAMFTLVGAFVLTPLLSRPAIALVGPPYRWLFGIAGKLARQNALRNPRRTAATASALTIGVTLISLLTVIGTSMGTAIDNQVTRGLKADYEIVAIQSQPLSPALLPAISQAPGVVAASPLDSQLMKQPVVSVGAETITTPVYGVDDKVIDQLMSPPMVSGSMAALPQGQLLIEQATASRQNLTVGSTMDMIYPDGTKAKLTIGGVYQTSDLEGTCLLSESVLSKHSAEPNYSAVLIKGANGATSQLQQALKDATGDNPLIQVQSHADLQKAFNTRITLLLDIMYGLLGMAVVIAILGVINTLAMAVFERKREIGMLRAIGLDRLGIKRMIRLESVVIAAFGAVLGVAIGTFLAWAVLRLSTESVGGLTTVIPYGQLGSYLVGAVLVGLLAALWPARSAARLNILESIKTDY